MVATVKSGESPIVLDATRSEHRYVVTVWDRSGSSSILAQLEVSAHDEGDAGRLARRLLLPEHRDRWITAERM